MTAVVRAQIENSDYLSEEVTSQWFAQSMPFNACESNEKLLSALCLCGFCKDESWARWFNLVPAHNHVGTHIHKRRWWHFWSPCILCIQGLGLPQLGATDLLYGKPCKECATWQIRLLTLLLTFYHLNWCCVRRRIYVTEKPEAFDDKGRAACCAEGREEKCNGFT